LRNASQGKWRKREPMSLEKTNGSEIREGKREVAGKLLEGERRWGSKVIWEKATAFHQVSLPSGEKKEG